MEQIPRVKLILPHVFFLSLRKAAKPTPMMTGLQSIAATAINP
jgi:hypothetical protein